MLEQLTALLAASLAGWMLVYEGAHLLARVPAHLALGTNKHSSGLGMAMSTWRLYRGGFIDVRLAAVPIAAAFAGSLAGARCALLGPESVFELILITLLPVAAALVMRKKTLEPEVTAIDPVRQKRLLALCAFVCGAYDGVY